MRTTTRVVLAVLTSAAALLAGCAGQGTPGSPAPASPVTSAEATPVASVAPVDPRHPRTGPATAAVGTPYPFDLYVHCGGEFTRFAGNTWQTSTPPGNLQPRPEPDGRTRVTGYLAGTMELVSADLARFVVDMRYVTAPRPVILFRPVTGSPPPCK